MNKKIIRLFASFFTLMFFVVGGLASQEKDRDCPVIIKVLPLNSEFLALDKQESFSESVSLTANSLKEKLPLDAESRYLDEYGYKIFWEYLSELKESSAAKPKGEEGQHPDHLLLKHLGAYRKTNLDNANPMVVRLVIHTTDGKTFPVDVGLFISGENNYQLTKKGGTEPINTENLLCSEVFNLKVDYSLPGFLKNDAIETRSSSKNFRSILKDRDNFTSDTDKVVKEEFKKREKQFQAIEGEIKQAIRDRIETKMCVALREYTSSPSGIIYGVPPFEEKFPITLPSLYNSTSMIIHHFIAVAERIFDINLGKGSRTTPPFTAVPPGEYNLFLRHIMKDGRLEKLCLNLFGRNALDGDGQDGCFQSAFSYYFTDSEQTFLKWLDGFERLRVTEKRVLSTDVIEKPSPSEDNIDIMAVEVIFLSYFDMCPACRGTISYLLTKTENGQKQPWLQRRILNFLQEEMVKKSIPRYNIKEKVDFNTFCVSLAKCNKGAQT